MNLSADDEVRLSKAQQKYAAEMATLRNSLSQPDDRILYTVDKDEIRALAASIDRTLVDLDVINKRLDRMAGTLVSLVLEAENAPAART